MTTVLIMDSNQAACLDLVAQLSQSNQFEQVLQCDGFASAQALLQRYEIKVILVDVELLRDSSPLHTLKQKHPEIGVVLVQGQAGVVDAAALLKFGAHAQISRLAEPMQIIASVAKALVGGKGG